MQTDLERLLDHMVRESLLAELVVFKLVELRELLLCDEVRFLHWAAQEVEQATEALRRAEAHGRDAVAAAAGARGLAADLQLPELAADLPEPWHSLVLEQADLLGGLCLRAGELLRDIRRMAGTSVQGIDDLLGRSAESGPADGLSLYGRGGRRDNGAPRPRVAQSL